MDRQCLNGWWDFYPIFDEKKRAAEPESGWREGAILVPSVWNKPPERPVVIDPERYPYRGRELGYEHDGDFAFDAYRYPVEWDRTRTAWLRRELVVERVDPERRYFLRFEGVMPRGTFFLNGRECGRHADPTLPWEGDVSGFLREGSNRLAVLVEDYVRDESGRAKVPTGNDIPCRHCGIWQDVYLIARERVYVSDVTVRTSTREGRMEVEVEIANTLDRPIELVVDADAAEWVKGADPDLAPTAREFAAQEVRIAAEGRRRIEFETGWADARRWDPADPFLHVLRIHMRKGEREFAPFFQRFGFREVWIEGKELMFNGYPLHLFSDWGHKVNLHSYAEGWIRKWFRMLRDGNMNHSRLHTHPHPEFIVELADEEGILITGETGLHGSGGAQGAACQEYWEAAREQVRGFVQRDKNHPSVILWSVENEMRWNNKSDHSELALAREELPKLRRLFNELDPTRPAYHEGDSSLWNEREQQILSRHYGKECAGAGWWDRTQPLSSGEMCLYHYAGPNNTCQLGGDEVWKEYRRLDEAAARDLELIVETGRALGVCCFGPWNQSANENLRLYRKEKKLEYDDYTTPGQKPLYAAPHTSEFTWWEEGKGYDENYSFQIQRRTFRPFALIDTSQRTGYFRGRRLERRLQAVNDTEDLVEGLFEIALIGVEEIAYAWRSEVVEIARGRSAEITFEWDIPEEIEPGELVYRASFLDLYGEELDRWQRSLRISGPVVVDGEMVGGKRIGVFGEGGGAEMLEELGCRTERVDRLGEEDLAGIDALVVDRNAVEPGSEQNRLLKEFVLKGGRMILLEQKHSLFPQLRLECKPVATAFARSADHPALYDLDDADFAFWGEDPYPLLDNDAYVAMEIYRKEEGRQTQVLLDSGEGGLGRGDLDYTPLFEAVQGEGLVLACQLRLGARYREIPAAARIMANLIERACGYAPEEEKEALLIDGGKVEGIPEVVKAAREGRTVLVEGIGPESVAAWSEALVLKLELVEDPAVYQAVKVVEDRLFAGVSNEDLCGVEQYTYCRGEVENMAIGRHFLRPCPGLESLAETPTESCLKEYFVLGGSGERLRANTVTRFLHFERPDAAVVIGRVRVGAGEVILSQFAPPFEERVRFRRVRNRMLANGGTVFAPELLDGDRVPAVDCEGAGYPQRVHWLNRTPGEEEFARMLEMTRPSCERMMSFPLMAAPGWTERSSRKGEWSAEGLDLGQGIFLYYFLNSPSPRQNILSEDGIPDPEALSFLDLRGEGMVRLFVNGLEIGRADLGEGSATIGDIALGMGYNHILLKWNPLSEESTLGMQWRDIMRRKETRFVFEAEGND